MSLFFKEGRK